MNSKILVGVSALLLGAVSVGAFAGDRYHRGRAHDRDARYAEVLRVDPLIERVRYTVPVEHCWNEQRAYRGGSGGGAVVGGVIGAAIGSNIGRGDDRPVTTIAGAIIGAAIGSQAARDDRGVRYETVRRCETAYEERWDHQVVGYRVSYVYRGRQDVVRLDYDPGDWVRIDDARRYG
jgi:uncharacterized protein YcfJ